MKKKAGIPAERGRSGDLPFSWTWPAAAFDEQAFHRAADERDAFQAKIDASIARDFVKWRTDGDFEKVWEMLGYERIALGAARYLFGGGLAQILRRVIWSQLLYEGLYGDGGSPKVLVKKKRKKNRKGFGGGAPGFPSAGDFAARAGLFALSCPSLWEHLETLRETYGQDAGEQFRSRIAGEMEAFGRALVIRIGRRRGARDRIKRKARARKPRHPEVSRLESEAGRAALYRRGQVIEREQRLPERGGVRRALEEIHERSGLSVGTLKKAFYKTGDSKK